MKYRYGLRSTKSLIGIPPCFEFHSHPFLGNRFVRKSCTVQSRNFRLQLKRKKIVMKPAWRRINLKSNRRRVSYPHCNLNHLNLKNIPFPVLKTYGFMKQWATERKITKNHSNFVLWQVLQWRQDHYNFNSPTKSIHHVLMSDIYFSKEYKYT